MASQNRKRGGGIPSDPAEAGPQDRPEDAASTSVTNSGPIAVHGNIDMSGAVVAGRDLTIGHLTALVDDGPPFGDLATTPGRRADVCPYPGIMAFEHEQAQFFHGRDDDRAAVVAQLDRSDLVAVIGSSGSGKSSLLAAGVLPALAEGLLPGSDRWALESLRPGSRPVSQLAARLANHLDDVSLLDATAAIEREPVQFARLCAQLAAGRGAPSLWFIDQLEEIFDDSVDPDERCRFFAALAAASSANDGTTKILLALRSDFYPHLDADQALATAVAAHQHRLFPLDHNAIRDVIVLPAEQVGLRVEPALIEEVLRDVEAGGNTLPLLAYALHQTWRSRRNGWLTLAGYSDSGGVRGALEQGANRAWDGLDASQKATARRVLLRLSQVGGGAWPTRRRTPVHDLITDVDREEQVVAIVERFAKARLLVVDMDDQAPEPMVEVAHETLLREWTLLRSWLAADRDAKRVQDELATGAAAWKEFGQDAAYLFRGARLDAVEALRKRGDVSVNDTERRFLGASRHLARRQRRRSRLLVGLAVSLVVALAMTGLVVREQRKTVQQKRLADAHQLAAEARSALAERRDTGALLGLAAVKDRADPTTSGTLIDALASTGGPLAYLTLDGARANALAPSLADRAAVVGASDGSIRLLSTDSGRQLASLNGHHDAVTAVAAADALVVSGDANGGVLVHHLGPDHSVMRLQGTGLPIQAVALDASRAIAAAATPDGSLMRWHLSDTAESLALVHVADGIAALVADEETGELVAATSSGRLLHWRTTTGEELPPLETEQPLRGAPNVRLMAAAGRLVAVDGIRLSVWDLARETERPLTADAPNATAVAATPAGEIFTGSDNGAVATWALTPTPVQVGEVRRGLESGVVAVAADGASLVALDGRGGMVSWDLARRRAPLSTPATLHENSVRAVAYGPDGTLASAGQAGDVRLTPPGRGHSRRAYRASRPVTSLAWRSADELLVGTTDGSVVTFNRRNGERQTVARPDGAPVIGVGTADNGAVAYVLGDGRVFVRQGSQTRHLRTSRVPVTSFALRRDGGAAAVGSGTGRNSTVTLWTKNYATVRHLRGHALTVNSIAFSHDGELVASGSDDHTIRLWSVSTGAFVRDLHGHTDMVRALAFSATSRVLASGSEDGTVRIWDVGTGQQLGAPLRYDPGFVWALATDFKGHLAAGNGNRVVLWGFGQEAWAKGACALAHRNLSIAEWRRWAPTHRPHVLCPGRPTPMP